MAWTAPMTAVANAIFTAAQYNTYVRDNLNETMVAKASSAGQYFVSDASRSVSPRTPSGLTITTATPTFSGATWTDLTSGALNSVTTGTEALVHVAGWLRSDTTDRAAILSFRVSGATTLAADDHSGRVIWDGVNSVNQTRMGTWTRLVNLTAGSNNFVIQGVTGAGVTVTYTWLHIFVVPLN